MLALAAVPLAVACGGGDESPAPTTSSTTVEEAPTTTHPTENPCFKFPLEVLRLQNDYRRDSRGIAGADEAAYRTRAQALLDESRRLGCPQPTGLSSFLD